MSNHAESQKEIRTIAIADPLRRFTPEQQLCCAIFTYILSRPKTDVKLLPANTIEQIASADVRIGVGGITDPAGRSFDIIDCATVRSSESLLPGAALGLSGLVWENVGMEFLHKLLQANCGSMNEATYQILLRKTWRSIDNKIMAPIDCEELIRRNAIKDRMAFYQTRESDILLDKAGYLTAYDMMYQLNDVTDQDLITSSTDDDNTSISINSSGVGCLQQSTKANKTERRREEQLSQRFVVATRLWLQLMANTAASTFQRLRKSYYETKFFDGYNARNKDLDYIIMPEYIPASVWQHCLLNRLADLKITYLIMPKFKMWKTYPVPVAAGADTYRAAFPLAWTETILRGMDLAKKIQVPCVNFIKHDGSEAESICSSGPNVQAYDGAVSLVEKSIIIAKAEKRYNQLAPSIDITEAVEVPANYTAVYALSESEEELLRLADSRDAQSEITVVSSDRKLPIKVADAEDIGSDEIDLGAPLALPVEDDNLELTDVPLALPVDEEEFVLELEEVEERHVECDTRVSAR